MLYVLPRFICIFILWHRKAEWMNIGYHKECKRREEKKKNTYNDRLSVAK